MTKLSQAVLEKCEKEELAFPFSIRTYKDVIKSLLELCDKQNEAIDKLKDLNPVTLAINGWIHGRGCDCSICEALDAHAETMKRLSE